MKRTNNQIFFNEIAKTLFNRQLTSSQKAGIRQKLKAFDKYDITDNRWRAYMLATSYHETGRTMQPVEEIGKGAGKPYGKKIKYDGTRYNTPDRIYYGRGDVQLTWYENYEMMGRLLNMPLLNQPELALKPEISARIMIEGMTRGISNRGDFTGVSLEDFFNNRRDDPYNARKIINGLDQANIIAGYYFKFLEAIEMAELN
jgi:putative chitinase